MAERTWLELQEYLLSEKIDFQTDKSNYNKLGKYF